MCIRDSNQGKALVAAGDLASAVSSFSAATQDASYATPYKAYLGLGSALEKLGNLTEAGVAYRQAAIDGTNPAPAGALASLGDCFVALQRPEAVSYTHLDVYKRQEQLFERACHAALE